MARIPQNFIDELLSRTDIVALIEHYVPLKKAGRDYQACCPFHNEKTPSFTVSPTKQFYHCFGCGAHGTALSFLIEHQRMDFRAAVEELARMHGLELPREVQAGPDDSHARLYRINEAAAQFFRDQLKQAPGAVEYLKQRAVSGETARRFGIGYAPPGWTNLLDKLGEPKLLEQAGLAIRREDGSGHYDRFRERLMFPIRDTRGRVIGFGGRTLGEDKPKYLNSPENALFHKGRNLYGLYELRQAVKDIRRLLVVEGYMDTLMLAQHGVDYVVATLGTATTEEHLQTLYRLTPEIVFCFDGDRAGRDAAWRALERAIPTLRDACELRFLFLPEAEDPDSLIQKEGKAAFLARLAQATPLSRYLLDQLTAQVDLGSVDGRARLVELARPHLARLPFSAFRTLLLEQLAGLTRLPRADLEHLVAQPAASSAPKAMHKEELPTRATPVRRALQWLLEQPRLADQVSDLDTLRAVQQLRGVTLLIEVIELFQTHPKLKAAGLLERLRGRPEADHLAKLMGSHPAGGADQEAAQEFRDCLARLLEAGRAQRTEVLLEKSASGELDAAEKRELRALLAARKP